MVQSAAAAVSPEQLARRVELMLNQKGVSGTLDIRVNEEGTVTLEGIVPSYYDRQVCLTCQSVPGVVQIIDRIQVRWPN